MRPSEADFEYYDPDETKSGVGLSCRDLLALVSDARDALSGELGDDPLGLDECETDEQIKSEFPLVYVFHRLLEAEQILKANAKAHTSATKSAASTQVEVCNDQQKSDSERVADCGATPCSRLPFTPPFRVISEYRCGTDAHVVDAVGNIVIATSTWGSDPEAHHKRAMLLIVDALNDKFPENAEHTDQP